MELFVSTMIVIGVWKFVMGGELTDFWPGVMFCYGVVLTIIADAVFKRAVLHRPPTLSPVFSVLVAIFFLAAGIGLGWLMKN